MTDEQRQRRVTRTAILLGIAAVVIYAGYIVLFVMAGGSGAASG